MHTDPIKMKIDRDQGGTKRAGRTNELFHRPLTTDAVRVVLNIPEAF